MSRPEILGWERYPENLPMAMTDQFAYDLEEYNSTLSSESSLLFVPRDEDTFLQVTEIGSAARQLNGMQEMESYLQESTLSSGSRIILIPQKTSLGHLWISEAATRKMLSHLHAFPPVLDTLHAFGKKRGDQERTGPCYSHRKSVCGRLKESSWLLRHVEQHGRADQTDPWIIRQMGVYHSIDETSHWENILVVNPSDRFQERAKAVEKTPSAGANIGLLLLSTTTKNWRFYVDYLETRLDILNKKIKQIVNYDVDFSHMVEVQNLRHKLCLARTAISRNCQVMASIKSESWDGRTVPENDTSTSIRFMAGAFQAELESMLIRADNLMLRLDGASTLVDSILNYNSTRAAQASNDKAGQMAVLARSDNELMVKMTKKSVADARTLKTITILTLVYLPASFVSTFLGMNYLSIEQTNPVTIKCKSEIVIFAVLTIALLMVTIGFWVVLEIRQRNQERREDADRRFSEKTWSRVEAIG